MIMGAMHVGVAVLFFALVNLLDWSPGEALMPFLSMGAGFLMLTLPLGIVTFLSPPATFRPWQCQQCGYPLFGLSGSTCPECGGMFDPARVAAAAEADPAAARLIPTPPPNRADS